MVYLEVQRVVASADLEAVHADARPLERVRHLRHGLGVAAAAEADEQVAAEEHDVAPVQRRWRLQVDDPRVAQRHERLAHGTDLAPA